MKRIAIAAAALMLTACATAPLSKYDWGTYEQSLYQYYKTPAEMNALVASLDASIVNAEKASRVVPPGLYAEYGYLLLQQGKTQDAIAFFGKEKAKWPESATLMNRMIKIAEVKSTGSEVKQ